VTTPSLIGQYRILRKIGAGGMGLVYLGEHTLLGRRAAIKTLLPSVAANAEIVERFFNEARATSAISDPGVIQVFDFGYHVDGTAYIVMELLEGESLAKRIERLGKLTLADALRIARQIAGSLGVAHARDIVHRDLKPDNIFLVADAEAQGGERSKILDFGICKVGAVDVHVTQSGAMVGTPVYMSPEQCRGAGDVDHRADIYAFGCLVFHMLTGRPPFVGDAPGDLIVAHLREEPPAASSLVASVPAAVDALIAKCLAKDPADRFASMAELSAALGELSVARAGSGPVAPQVAPEMSLGKGFRSMYDVNLAALLGTGSVPLTAALRAKLNLMPTPHDSGPLPRVELPRRRFARAAAAGVLMIGVAIGLVATSLVIDSQENHASAEAATPVEREAVPAMPTQRPVEPAPPVAALRAADPEVEHAPEKVAPAADEVAPAAHEVAPATDEIAPARREARDVKPAPAKRTRAASPPPRAARSSSSSSAPSTPSPSAPEDLYDTR
jgi:serine/threonine protein kinase